MTAKSLILGLGFLLLTTGCSNGTRTVRVAVPPRVDLQSYRTVGLVNFSSNAKGDLDRMSTQRFLRAVQEAQPGTRVVELGTEQQVLASVNGRSWDRATIHAVKEAHGVDAIIIGRLDVEKSKPEVQLSTLIKRVSVSQDANVELTARLVETDSGATMWTDGAKCTTNLSHASFNDRGRGNFGASDPEAAYGEMIDGLVWQVTDAFRVRYVTRRVPREQTAVANAD